MAYRDNNSGDGNTGRKPLVLLTIFFASSAFGFYSTVGSMLATGHAELIEIVAKPGTLASFPGAPAPFKVVFTGLPAIDGLLSMAVGFFSNIIDGDVAPEHTLLYAWFMAQYVAAWGLIVLEARRWGNRGLLISWTGVFGTLFQNLGWATISPVWLALHLLTSPIAALRAGSSSASQLLAADTADLTVLPWTVTLAFLVPGVLMSIPKLLSRSTAIHYNLNAFWQFFPLWTTIVHYVLRKTIASGTNLRENLRTSHRINALRKVYRLLLAFSIATHLPVLVLSLLPASYRASLATQVGPEYATYVERATFSRIFVPYLPRAAPPLVPAELASGDLGLYSGEFLRYDALVGAVVLMLWATRLHQRVIVKPGLLGLLGNIGTWTVLGGPHAAVVKLIWDRDEAMFSVAGEDMEKTT